MNKLEHLIPPSIIFVYTALYLFYNQDLATEDMLLVKPLIYAVLALSVYVGLRAVAGHQESGDKSARKGTLPVANRIGFVLITIAYLVALQYAFVLSSSAYLVATMVLLGVRKKIFVGLMAIGYPIFLYILFSYLMVPLPHITDRF